MRAWSIIVAAGRGERLLDATGGVSKQFLEWRGEPLYMAFARTLACCARMSGVVFVFPAEVLAAEEARLRLLAKDLGLEWRCAAGGARRQDSVRNGLAVLPRDCDFVLVHDAARPFASAVLVNRVLDALAAGAAGVIPGVPLTDTVKKVRDGIVELTLDREKLSAVQTPQGFAADALVRAHRRAVSDGVTVTDDAALLEWYGATVRVVAGETANIKITRAEDLAMLKEERLPVFRTGFGYDVHAYIDPDEARARPLVLGGVPVPEGKFAVRAHSDGDVLLHALMDALLGCVGGGDIGKLFPNRDPALDNVSSAALLAEVLSLVRGKGFAPAYADLTIIAQKPAIAPHREAIRANVARLMDLPVGVVNLKATTEEGLGFTGSLEGLKAVALVGGTLRA